MNIFDSAILQRVEQILEQDTEIKEYETTNNNLIEEIKKEVTPEGRAKLIKLDDNIVETHIKAYLIIYQTAFKDALEIHNIE